MAAFGRALQFARLEYRAIGLIALLARGVERLAGALVLPAVFPEPDFQRLALEGEGQLRPLGGAGGGDRR